MLDRTIQIREPLGRRMRAEGHEISRPEPQEFGSSLMPRRYRRSTKAPQTDVGVSQHAHLHRPAYSSPIRCSQRFSALTSCLAMPPCLTARQIVNSGIQRSNSFLSAARKSRGSREAGRQLAQCVNSSVCPPCQGMAFEGDWSIGDESGNVF